MAQFRATCRGNRGETSRLGSTQILAMAQFRAICQGNRGGVSRLGSTQILATAKSWRTRVDVQGWKDSDGNIEWHVILVQDDKRLLTFQCMETSS